MKIRSLKLQNFAKFTEFSCEFSDTITRLVGVNGSGKTSVGLVAIWAGLKGIAEKSKEGQLVGERFRFIGSARASADIEIVLIDEATAANVVITNHITKQSNEISFQSDSPKLSVDDNWLHNLLNVAFLSAKNFARLDSKEQALLLGIDTSTIDAKIKLAKEDATLLNRDMKTIGVPVEPTGAIPKRVSIAALVLEKDKIEEFNRNQDKAQTDIEIASNGMKLLAEEQAELERKLTAVIARIKKGEEYLKKLPAPQTHRDVSKIKAQIDGAEAVNKQVDAYESYVTKKKACDSKQVEIDANKEKQEKLKQERLDLIGRFDFGFDGLSVDDDGALLLNGRPIREPHFSRGELEMIVAKLYVSMNPTLKMRFIDDFENIDDENQQKLLESLLKDGFQVITAEVRKTNAKDNTLLLRECKVVSEKSQKKEKLV